MPKLTVFTSLLLALTATSAWALTVTRDEATHKTSAISLQTVPFQGETRTILADAKGFSLYTFDADTENQSNCTGECLKVWPPLHVSEHERLFSPYSKIIGNDGQPQLTLKGLPLYHYERDQRPGDTFGHYPGWQLVFVND